MFKSIILNDNNDEFQKMIHNLSTNNALKNLKTSIFLNILDAIKIRLRVIIFPVKINVNS